MKIPVALHDFLVRAKFRPDGDVLRSLREHVDWRHRHVLDFGCGTGRAAHLFSPSRYVGVDIDRDRLIFAKQANPRHAFVAVGETRPLPFRDAMFDLVLAFAVLHHISDSAGRFYAGEFRRLLRPGGITVLLEPSYRSRAPLTNLMMSLFDEGHYIRSPGGYAALLISHFHVRLHCELRTPNLYNAVLMSGRPLDLTTGRTGRT